MPESAPSIPDALFPEVTRGKMAADDTRVCRGPEIGVLKLPLQTNLGSVNLVTPASV